MKVGKSRLGGAIYILPNLITSGNLFFGFLSILKAVHGEMVWAAGAILLAAVFDILDGRVARMTGATSEFGVQYDSLCDLVSFGVAPAFLMYQFGLSELGRVGWLLCFVFVACGALRLARFNVQSSIGKASGDFTGLPIPMAAGVLSAWVLAVSELNKSGLEEWFWPAMQRLLMNSRFHEIMNLVLVPCLGILMVSNINFRSHKNFKIKGLSPFKFLVIAVIILGCVAINPEVLGFLAFAGYALSGPVEFIFGGKRAVNDDEIFESDVDEATDET